MLTEVNVAYIDALKNKAVQGSEFIGKSGRITIKGYIDEAGKVITAFPKYEL